MEWLVFPRKNHMLDNPETTMNNVWQVPETRFGWLNHVVLQPLQSDFFQNQRINLVSVPQSTKTLFRNLVSPWFTQHFSTWKNKKKRLHPPPSQRAVCALRAPADAIRGPEGGAKEGQVEGDPGLKWGDLSWWFFQGDGNGIMMVYDVVYCGLLWFNVELKLNYWWFIGEFLEFMVTTMGFWWFIVVYSKLMELKEMLDWFVAW